MVTAINCQTCLPPRSRNPVTSKCECPPKFYDDGINVACAPCPVSCDNCQLSGGSVICTSCPTGMNRVTVPVNNQCPCVSGYF